MCAGPVSVTLLSTAQRTRMTVSDCLTRSPEATLWGGRHGRGITFSPDAACFHGALTLRAGHATLSVV